MLLSAIDVASLLQAFVAFAGVAWKLSEGFALLEVTNPLRLFRSSNEEANSEWLGFWLEILTGISLEAMREYWPWFSLHLFLYVGQLIPFVIIILLIESPLEKKGGKSLRLVALLGALSSLCGFSTAMPVVSSCLLSRIRLARPRRTSGVHRRATLGSLLVFSTVTHIGAFSVAFVATCQPSLIAAHAAGPLNIMNILLDVPSPAYAELLSAVVRQARLRHINEMTGTSSGFFLTAGLLWHALEYRGRRVTTELLMWMFLVSLIAGPAAGGAAILLLLDFILGDEPEQRESSKKQRA